jgi:putative transposase
MTLFTNKYRVESSRLKGWDYSNSAAYYVTICTKDMAKHFGEIARGKVLFSKSGKIINEEWQATGVLRKNVILDEYIVMPNHFHAIIFIVKSDNSKLYSTSGYETTQRVVSTHPTLKANSLGSIIGQFKTKCTKRIREFNSDFYWQDKFYDRIIRNDKELNSVREYIYYNPIKWAKDEFYS